MQRALSTYLFINHHLTGVWLERIWNAGIPLVELFCARQHLDYRNKAQTAELGHWFRDAELKVHSIHSPLYSDEVGGQSGPQARINITERAKPKRLQMVDEIKRAIEIAETIPCRYLIQHVGVAGEEFDMHKVDAAFSALEEIHSFASNRGVELLLENTPNDLSSAQRLLTFLELTRMNLNVCFDTGHANMGEGIDAAYGLLKSRIRSTHIHDNDGKDDSHLFPLAGGTIDWPRAMDTLRSAGDPYPLLLEVREVPEMANPLGAVRETFDRLESLTAKHES